MIYNYDDFKPTAMTRPAGSESGPGPDSDCPGSETQTTRGPTLRLLITS